MRRIHIHNDLLPEPCPDALCALEMIFSIVIITISNIFNYLKDLFHMQTGVYILRLFLSYVFIIMTAIIVKIEEKKGKEKSKS